MNTKKLAKVGYPISAEEMQSKIAQVNHFFSKIKLLIETLMEEFQTVIFEKSSLVISTSHNIKQFLVVSVYEVSVAGN